MTIFIWLGFILMLICCRTCCFHVRTFSHLLDVLPSTSFNSSSLSSLCLCLQIRKTRTCLRISLLGSVCVWGGEHICALKDFPVPQKALELFLLFLRSFLWLALKSSWWRELIWVSEGIGFGVKTLSLLLTCCVVWGRRCHAFGALFCHSLN